MMKFIGSEVEYKMEPPSMMFGNLVFGPIRSLFEGKFLDTVMLQYEDMKVNSMRAVEYRITKYNWELILVKIPLGYIPIIGDNVQMSNSTIRSPFVYSDDGNYVLCKEGITKFFLHKSKPKVEPSFTGVFFKNFTPLPHMKMTEEERIEYTNKLDLKVRIRDNNLVIRYANYDHEARELIAVSKINENITVPFKCKENIWKKHIVSIITDARFVSEIAKVKPQDFVINPKQFKGITAEQAEYIYRIMYACAIMQGKQPKSSEPSGSTPSLKSEPAYTPVSTPTPALSWADTVDDEMPEPQQRKRETESIDEVDLAYKFAEEFAIKYVGKGNDPREGKTLSGINAEIEELYAQNKEIFDRMDALKAHRERIARFENYLEHLYMCASRCPPPPPPQ